MNRRGSAADAPAATAADKVLGLLGAFPVGGEATLTELARAANLPKSTAHRLLGALHRHAFVERSGESGYRLGLGAWQLGQRARPYHALIHAARPHLDKLTGISGESTFLTVPEQAYAMCLVATESPSLMRLTLRVGSLVAMPQGASNRILLAFLPPRQRDVVVQRWVEDRADRRALEGDLARVRADGYVLTSSQLTAGTTAIAVPVLDQKGALIAGLSIGGPTDRFDETVALGHLDALRAHADAIAHEVAVSQQLATPS